MYEMSTRRSDCVPRKSTAQAQGIEMYNALSKEQRHSSASRENAVQSWMSENREFFERDVLHDFCLVSGTLAEQFVRLRLTSALSFPVLRDLVGDPMNKGLLWRLKDTAHHLFRDYGPENPAGALLDWTLGYIFHESFKMMEDAHQRQYYAPRLSAFSGQEYDADMRALVARIVAIKGETDESMRREANRLETLLRISRRLFCLLFAGRACHRPLARLLHDREAMVAHAFEDDYPALLLAVYGDEPERRHIEAAHSLVQSARQDEAAKAVETALSINPASREALALRDSLSVA